MGARGRILERGERVHLRTPTAADVDAYVSLVRRSRRLHRGLMSPASTPDAYANWLRRMRRPTHQAFLVCRNEDAELLGGINANEIVRGFLQSAYLGYWAGGPHAGRGYLTEGLGLVLRHAFGPMGLHRVEANIQPENARSIALVRRLGFRKEGYSPRYLKISGRWRDHERWALLAEDWRERRRRRR